MTMVQPPAHVCLSASFDNPSQAHCHVSSAPHGQCLGIYTNPVHVPSQTNAWVPELGTNLPKVAEKFRNIASVQLSPSGANWSTSRSLRRPLEDIYPIKSNPIAMDI